VESNIIVLSISPLVVVAKIEQSSISLLVENPVSDAHCQAILLNTPLKKYHEATGPDCCIIFYKAKNLPHPQDVVQILRGNLQNSGLNPITPSDPVGPCEIEKYEKAFITFERDEAWARDWLSRAIRTEEFQRRHFEKFGYEALVQACEKQGVEVLINPKSKSQSGKLS
jgi:hypothetical protein